jgi:oligosaccharide repeat unit polymerase
MNLLALARLKWLRAASVGSLSILTGVLIGQGHFALVGVVVASPTLLCFRARSRDTRSWWSPARIYLPVLLAYNLLSILLARPPSTSTQITLLVTSAACFLVGYGVTQHASEARDSQSQQVRGEISGRRLVLLHASGTLASLVIFKHSGIPVFMSDPNLGRVLAFENGYLATITVVSLQVVAIVGCLEAFKREAAPTIRRIRLIQAMLALATLSLHGNRGVVILPIIVIVISLFWRRPIPTLRLALAGMLAFVLLSALGYMRNSSSFGPSYDRDLALENYEGSERYIAPGLQYVTATSTTFDLTLNAIPNLHNFSYGRILVSPLISPLPGSQESADLYLKRIFGFQFVGFGLALGAMNALYIDFGYPGILGGFFALGLIGGWVFARARIRGGCWVPVYGCVMTLLLLSNYGHPFAYLSYLLIPFAIRWTFH